MWTGVAVLCTAICLARIATLAHLTVSTSHDSHAQPDRSGYLAVPICLMCRDLKGKISSARDDSLERLVESAGVEAMGRFHWNSQCNPSCSNGNHEASFLAELCCVPSERQKRFHHSRHWDEQKFPLSELC
jgi:hypothetical protein